MGGDTIKYSTLNTDAFRVTKVFNRRKQVRETQLLAEREHFTKL